MGNVPNLRFSQFSGEWEEKRIEDISTIIDSLHQTPKKYEDNGFPMIRVTDVNNKELIIDECLKVSEKIFMEFTKKYLPKINDIILSRVGTCGASVILKNSDKICLGQNTVLINSKINSLFLYMTIKSTLIQYQIIRKVVGSTQKTLSLKDLKKFRISIPHKQEQEKIASFLSAVDKKIEKLEEKIVLQEKYKKAMMQKLFSQEIRFSPKGTSSQAQGEADDGSNFPAWEEKKLGDLTKINQGLQIAISERYTEKVKDSYFYITNEFLRKGSSKKYFIKEPSASVICNEDDVLMTRTGNTGQVVTNVNGAFHNNFFRINYFKNFDKDFLVYFLRMRNTQNMILRYAGTSTIPDLNHGDFYRLKIDLPSLKEQQKIAKFLSSLDKKIEATKKQKQKANEFKKGLLQQMFV